MVNSGTGESGDAGCRTRSKMGPNQQGRESLRGAHRGHQDHRKQQRREIGPDKAEEARH